MLKSDLHIHTSEDRTEQGIVKYSAKELIDYAAKHGFEIISITNHEILTYTKKLADYAKKKGILLIPAIEKRIEGKEVLLYNFDKKILNKIRTFNDLKKYKTKNNLVIAPHPFYFYPQCLGKKLIENIDVFDAVEYCHFYRRTINPNKKAIEVAKKYKKPIVGNSDAHKLWQMNHTYSLIDSEKKINSIIQAVKKGKTFLKTEKLPLNKFVKIICWTSYSKMARMYAFFRNSSSKI